MTEWSLPETLKRRLARARPAIPEFGYDLEIDQLTGDLKLDGSGDFALVANRDAWIQWCRIAVLVQRARWAIFPRSFGLDAAGILREPDPARQLLLFTTGIRAAIRSPWTGPVKITAVEQLDSDAVRVVYQAAYAAGEVVTQEVTIA